jgi:hypothetical protein
MKISKKILREIEKENKDFEREYAGKPYTVVVMAKAFLNTLCTIFKADEIVQDELSELNKKIEYLDSTFYNKPDISLDKVPPEIIECETNTFGIGSGDMISTTAEVKFRIRLLEKLLPHARIDRAKLGEILEILEWIKELDEQYAQLLMIKFRELKIKFPELSEHEISEMAEEDPELRRIYRRARYLERNAFGLARGDCVTFGRICELTLKLVREIVI